MILDIDVTKVVISIASAVAIAIIMYIGSTVHNLDRNSALIEYKIEQINIVLQDIYDEKKDK